MASVSYCLILRIAFVKVIVVRKPLKIIKKEQSFGSKSQPFFPDLSRHFSMDFHGFPGTPVGAGSPLGPPWVLCETNKVFQRRIVRELRLQRLELTKFHLWWPGTKPIVKPWSFMGQHGTTQPEMRRSNIYDRLTLFVGLPAWYSLKKGN